MKVFFLDNSVETKHIPGVDDLALHRVVVVDAFNLRINRFPRVVVQSNDQPTIMLVLWKTSADTFQTFF